MRKSNRRNGIPRMQRYIIQVGPEEFVGFGRGGIVFVPLEDAALMVKERAAQTILELDQRYKMNHGREAVAPMQVLTASIAPGVPCPDIYQTGPTRLPRA